MGKSRKLPPRNTAAEGETFPGRQRLAEVKTTDSVCNMKSWSRQWRAVPGARSVRCACTDTFTHVACSTAPVARAVARLVPGDQRDRRLGEALDDARLAPIGSSTFPQDLAYGARGAGSIPPYSALIIRSGTAGHPVIRLA